jgi:cob(I)alamin adenosyltransferase
MVRLDKIVTKAGDGGQTRLATGEQVSKASPRVEAYGAVDEANSAIGVARLHAEPRLDAILNRVQNDLFDLGADLATPATDKFEALRITDAQVDRLESEIDALHAAQTPLTSFVLPGGSPAAAHLHLARAIARRAERAIAALMESETINPAALKYANRLSDLLFVMARAANNDGASDVLWVPGANR